jgi:Protein of unknown function (DUF2442)
MSVTEKMRAVVGVKSVGSDRLHVIWSDGTEADLDLSATLGERVFAALRDPAEFAGVEPADWGHSVVWPSGAELGADALCWKPYQRPVATMRGCSLNGGSAMVCR